MLETKLLEELRETVYGGHQIGLKDRVGNMEHHHSHTRERVEKMEKYIDETTKGRKQVVLTLIVAIMSSAAAIGVAVSNRQVNEEKMQIMVETVTKSVLKAVDVPMDSGMEAGSSAP